MTDHFTRFTQAYETCNKSAKTAASKRFNNFILQFGVPTKIHHNRGAEFNNHLFNHLYKLCGISTSNTTPCHPMGNDLPERINRTMINMSKPLPDNFKINWKNHLAKLNFTYNSTENKSTGFISSYLMFGRESRLPIDNMFQIQEYENRYPNHSYNNFIKR